MYSLSPLVYYPYWFNVTLVCAVLISVFVWFVEGDRFTQVFTTGICAFVLALVWYNTVANPTVYTNTPTNAKFVSLSTETSSGYKGQKTTKVFAAFKLESGHVVIIQVDSGQSFSESVVLYRN